jgi:hypothetical protein
MEIIASSLTARDGVQAREEMLDFVGKGSLNWSSAECISSVKCFGSGTLCL